MRTGSPVLELIRVSFDQLGRGVEHLHAFYRPDRYAFEIDLMRSGAADTKAWSPIVRGKGRAKIKLPNTGKLNRTEKRLRLTPSRQRETKNYVRS